MATSQDFDNISESGNANMASQWRYIARAVKGLKTVFLGTTNYLSQGTQNLTIANDLISGYTNSVIFLSPQSGTTDDLIGLTPPSGLPNGTFVTLRLLNGAHTITVKHNSGSTSNKIQLADGIDFYLNNTNQSLTLMYNNLQWYEHTKNAREDENNVGTLGLYQNSWGNQSNGLRYIVMPNSSLWIYGRCSNTSGVSSGSTIFTLPSGYRTLDVQFRASVVANIGSGNYLSYLIISGSSGNVTWQESSGVTYPAAPHTDINLFINTLVPNIGR